MVDSTSSAGLPVFFHAARGVGSKWVGPAPHLQRPMRHRTKLDPIIYDDEQLTPAVRAKLVVARVVEHVMAATYQQVRINAGRRRADTNDRWLADHGEATRERLEREIGGDPARQAFRLEQIGAGKFLSTEEIAQLEVARFPMPTLDFTMSRRGDAAFKPIEEEVDPRVAAPWLA